MHIGEYINFRRKALGYTQQQLADILEVTRQAVCKWEKALSLPDIMILPDLAYALKISPRFMMKMIWFAGLTTQITHFVQIIVTEKDGESYAIRAYEFPDFLPAAELYNVIRAGSDTHALDLVESYYEYDPYRTFKIILKEVDCDGLDDINGDYLLIDSRDITPVVTKHFKNLG